MEKFFFTRSYNKLSQIVNIEFQDKLNAINDDNLRNKYSYYNSEILGYLFILNLEKCFISLTSSESIFYRFKIFNNPFEFMWEFFLDFDGEGNSGSVLHIYKNKLKEISTSGDIKFIYETVYNYVFMNDEIANENFKLYPISNSIPEFNFERHSRIVYA